MSASKFPPPAPPIAIRSDEQFVRELAELRRAHVGGPPSSTTSAASCASPKR